MKTKITILLALVGLGLSSCDCLDCVTHTPITAKPAILTYEASGGPLISSIISNTNWQVVSFPNWVTVDKTSGQGGRTELVITAKPTDGTDYRKGIVTVMDTNGNKFDITVIQNDLEILFEDANFKSICVGKYDLNGDGKLTRYEADKVAESLNVAGTDATPGNLTSLRMYTNGANGTTEEYFPNLKNLDCGWNQISNLDISGYKNLEVLFALKNPLNLLDITNCSNLIDLNIVGTLLTSLNFAGCTSLKKIDAEYNQGLTTVDFTEAPALTELRFGYNLNITSINISKNKELEKLRCFGVGNDSPGKLASLDISQNKKLKEVSVPYSPLLTFLDCSNNPLIEYIQAYRSGLTFINLKNANKLTYLHVSKNALQSIDLSDCTELITFYCANNRLGGQSLDISNNTKLITFNCHYNAPAITTIYVWPGFDTANIPTDFIGAPTSAYQPKP